MIFPFSNSRSNEHLEDPGGRIDRYLADRTQRLSAGLAVGRDFCTVIGTLLITRGRGKYLRVNHARSVKTTIPNSTAAECRKILMATESAEGVSSAQLAQAKYDLASLQAETAEKLKAHAGKYVDRLLTLAVTDPGHWSTDFDGQLTYTSLCDATRLAELSGLTVIDSFPARDLAVAGSGSKLEALPLWLLLADRSSRIANHHIAVFNVGREIDVFILPPSDGLDAEVPQIRHWQIPGTKLVELLIEHCRADHNAQSNEGDLEIAKCYVNGKRHAPLIETWKQQADSAFGVSGSLHLVATKANNADFEQAFVNIAKEWQAKQRLAFATLLRSAIAFVGDSLKSKINSLNGREDLQNRIHLERVWVCAPDRYEATLINQVQQSFPRSEIKTIADLGISADPGAVVAAILGLMHVDQMPANVPWITGAQSQRILGQLTPGRPSCWRQLLMDMADFQPPAMRLNDAV